MRDSLRRRNISGQLQDLQHDGQVELEIFQLAQQVGDLVLLETPHDLLTDVDLFQMAFLIFDLVELGHSLDLFEDAFTLILDVEDRFDGQGRGDDAALLHGAPDLLQHEGEVGDAFGDVLDFAVGVLHLHLYCVEDEGESESGAGSSSDGADSVKRRWALDIVVGEVLGVDRRLTWDLSWHSCSSSRRRGCGANRDRCHVQEIMMQEDAGRWLVGGSRRA